MSSTQGVDQRTLKAKKTGAHPPSLGIAGKSAGPTTFFLKSEKELEKEHKSTQRGRRISSSSTAPAEQITSDASTMTTHSSFGVQSLEDTISSAYQDEADLSRSTSNSSELSSMPGDDVYGAFGRKRKAGNRVHPTILATGQRIISSDHSLPQVVAGASSPTISAGSPLVRRVRRSSATSSINMSQPLTPIRLSPHPQAATPSDPRSVSPKSFRLSDEEESSASESILDTNSDAILSEGDHNDSPVRRMPRLVMPSLTMPTRRPFTEKGRQIGRARIMVIGPKGIGKTSLLNSIFRTSEHIVHADQLTTVQSSVNAHSEQQHPASTFVEVSASTKPYPTWWIDAERSRSLHRRQSIGEGVLERNLTFIDTPALTDDDSVQRVLDHVKLGLRRTSSFESMSDSEIVSLLCGDGGVHIDAVLYVFDPVPAEYADAARSAFSALHQDLLRCLCMWTNFIPLVGRADSVTLEQLEVRKGQISRMLQSLNAEPYRLGDAAADGLPYGPHTVSSALVDDTETLDASILMSSQYLEPLAASELKTFVDLLLEPTNIARMRHESATKYISWRQENGIHLTSRSPYLRSSSPGITSTGSVLEDPSKVLVPHSSSSYYRSASPAISDLSTPPDHGVGTSEYALAKYNEQAPPSEPFRQVRIAKWAQDLKRSLDNERKKYVRMYSNQLSDSSSDEGEKQLVAKDVRRPKAGRLGGELGVIDPRDPLGVLAFGQRFRRRGFVLLRVIGGCGVVGAVAYWVVRNWADVQEYFGFSQPVGMIHTAAVPAPESKSGFSWAGLDDVYMRGFFGWADR